MQYCTRNPAIKKPELSDAASIIDINDNMDVIDSIICKSNFNGATDPGVGDDIDDGYSVGSNWWNVTDHRLFVAESVATGAAVWRQVYPINGYIDGPIEITYPPENGVDRYLRIGLYLWLMGAYFGANNYIGFNAHLSTSSASVNKFVPVYNPGHGFIFNGSFNPTCALYGINWASSSAEKEIDADFTKVIEFNTNGNVWIGADCSAATFIDRTPGYSGDALKELKRTRSDAQGKIIHQTLPRFARAKFIDAATGEETEGRNIGNMVSVLTRAVQQLMEKLEVAERKIEQLEEEIQ